MRLHEGHGPGVEPDPSRERLYLTEDRRRARIQELGKPAELVRDVYALVSRKLLGRTNTVHGRLCNLAHSAPAGAEGLAMRRQYQEMIGDIADFQHELFALLGRYHALSDQDVEAIKTEWRLSLNGRAEAKDKADYEIGGGT
jgi:hypothetical protein